MCVSEKILRQEDRRQEKAAKRKRRKGWPRRNWPAPPGSYIQLLRVAIFSDFSPFPPTLNLLAVLSIVKPLFSETIEEYASVWRKTSIRERNSQKVIKPKFYQNFGKVFPYIGDPKGIVRHTQPGFLASQKCGLQKS